MEEKLTVILAAVQFEAQANRSQVLRVGQDSDHICAHNWRRQFVFNCAICVFISAKCLFFGWLGNIFRLVFSSIFYSKFWEISLFFARAAKLVVKNGLFGWPKRKSNEKLGAKNGSPSVKPQNGS